MEKHACKLCHRSFSNGRALGGHMRSHVVSAAASEARVKSPLVADYSSSSTSSREVDEGKGMGYGLRENPKRSFRMVDPEFSTTCAAIAAVNTSSSTVAERESETDTSPEASATAFSIRSTGSKRPLPSDATLELLEAELLNSFSNVTPEVDLAITFMLLSRDVWNKYEDEGAIVGGEETMIDSKHPPSPAKGRSRFQCGSCKKVFRSYQALGGHRASHKKSRSCLPLTNDARSKDASSIEANADGSNHPLHVCPICFREFPSGQALGGHKRSHLSSSIAAVTAPSPPRPAKLRKSLFDLNLPAPMDDDAELPAVSET